MSARSNVSQILAQSHAARAGRAGRPRARSVPNIAIPVIPRRPPSPKTLVLLSERVENERETISKKQDEEDRRRAVKKARKRVVGDPDDVFASLSAAAIKDNENAEFAYQENEQSVEEFASSTEEEQEEVDFKSDGKKTRFVDLFNPREKGAGQLFVFVGKSERGKTHMLRYLLYHGCSRENDPFRFGIIFVRTKFKQSYKFNNVSAPYVRVYEGFLIETLKAYVKNLEMRFKKYGSLGRLSH